MSPDKSEGLCGPQIALFLLEILEILEYLKVFIS